MRDGNGYVVSKRRLWDQFLVHPCAGHFRCLCLENNGRFYLQVGQELDITSDGDGWWRVTLLIPYPGASLPLMQMTSSKCCLSRTLSCRPFS